MTAHRAFLVASNTLRANAFLVSTWFVDDQSFLTLAYDIVIRSGVNDFALSAAATTILTSIVNDVANNDRAANDLNTKTRIKVDFSPGGLLP